MVLLRRLPAVFFGVRAFYGTACQGLGRIGLKISRAKAPRPPTTVTRSYSAKRVLTSVPISLCDHFLKLCNQCSSPTSVGNNPCPIILATPPPSVSIAARVLLLVLLLSLAAREVAACLVLFTTDRDLVTNCYNQI